MFGGNCQRIGPNLAPSLSTPLARKFASGAAQSFSRFMWVMKRGPFSENTKSSGVSSSQAAKVSGRCIA